MQNNWRQLEDSDERVIELSGVLQHLPIHPHDLRSDTFRNPNGVARKTADIASQHPDYRGRPTNGGVTDRMVLQNFLEDPDHMQAVATALRAAVLAGELKQLPVPQIDEDTEEAADDEAGGAEAREGRLLRRWHYARERDRPLRKKKIAEFLARHDRVFCEICLFDFEKVYGSRGAQFTECHHVTPLHVSGDTTTKLDDLILLCANCHRMIHRGSPWLTPDDLRALIDANRA
ncbi:HNH endonuclease [Nocardia sp. NPDC059246]|uniref:HNH endonuclease n=1 Tax=unclassified Nocardia TaxID=2637762 RepID=UPI003688F4A9